MNYVYMRLRNVVELGHAWDTHLPSNSNCNRTVALIPDGTLEIVVTVVGVTQIDDFDLGPG